MIRMLPWGAAALLLVGMLALAYLAMFTPVTTVLIVRHAEKNNDTDTTGITDAGKDRAAALAAAVADAGITRIFVTDRPRTRLTALPAAERLNIVPTVIPMDATGGLIDSIRACSGATVLVVGHNTTIPAILSGLGVYEPVSIARDGYDDLLAVTMTVFRSSVVHLKYGRPS